MVLIIIDGSGNRRGKKTYYGKVKIFLLVVCGSIRGPRWFSAYFFSGWLFL